MRREIIWDKTNAKTESVRDRPSKAHEYFYLLTKRQRYWYDQYGYQEPIHPETWGLNHNGGYEGLPLKVYEASGVENLAAIKRRIASRAKLATGRNMRSVWHIPTANYPGSHFAVMPEELAERALRVSCPPYVCADCKKPWRRVLQKGAYKLGIPTLPTEEWQPACKCADAPAEPGVVFDPFGGAGTVAVVARRNTRRSIYIDCAAEYLEMAQRRLGAPDEMPLSLFGPSLTLEVKQDVSTDDAPAMGKGQGAKRADPRHAYILPLGGGGVAGA